MKKQKQFEPIDHSKIMPAWKVLLLFSIIGVFVFPVLYDGFSYGKPISSWVGFDIGIILQVFPLVYLFWGRRFEYLFLFYKRSNRAPVKTIYESQILRLTYTLLSLEDQESIMEPVYSDWITERNDDFKNGEMFAAFRLDSYYYIWFSWRIWRETRLREMKRKCEVRFDVDFYKPPSILPK